MAARVLYLGDTSLLGAAAYLAGVMRHMDWTFDYIPSHVLAGADLFDLPHSLYVLSDYPANRLAHELQHRLLRHVEAGAGLLMIGGWESYRGCGGDWQDTAVAAALPVQIAASDDRVNCDQPTLVRCVADHPTVAGLPWDSRPPCIGGFNRFRPNPEGQVVLEIQRFEASRAGTEVHFKPVDSDPLLVVGQWGRGRTAALATDAAPHWVGGMVDWGPGRVTAHAPGADPIEVGNLYVQFFEQLLRWCGGDGA